MGKIRWYKRDPDAALSGMMGLTLEERGAYNTVLDLIYSRGGEVPDDDRFIAGWLRVDVRVWKRLRERLLSIGKLYHGGGSLRNERADREVLEALSRVASAADAGRASARRRGDKSTAEKGKNNDLAGTDVDTAVQRPFQLTTTTSTNKKEESPLPPLEVKPREPRRASRDAEPDGFDDFWQAYPRKVAKGAARRAWPKAVRKAGGDCDRLIKAATATAQASALNGTEPRFIKHPATWLSGECWSDEQQPQGKRYSDWRLDPANDGIPM